MKRLTAVLLAISLTISACAAPSGSSAGSGSGAASGGQSQAGEQSQAGGQSQTESGEGFVAAGEDREETAGEQAQDSTSGSSAEGGAQAGLVIIEEREGNYRSAAGKKKSKATDPANSVLKAAEGSGENTPKVSQKKDYTVMVYIVGSNLESRYGSATNDIAEMRQAGLDYDKTNLLVYTGGSKRWVSDIPSTSNNVLDLSKDPEEKDSKERIVAHTDKSANMGIPQTLSEFVNYCAENYPAQHYGLILWNHGGGPLFVYVSNVLF